MPLFSITTACLPLLVQYTACARIDDSMLDEIDPAMVDSDFNFFVQHKATAIKYVVDQEPLPASQDRQPASESTDSLAPVLPNTQSASQAQHVAKEDGALLQKPAMFFQMDSTSEVEDKAEQQVEDMAEEDEVERIMEEADENVQQQLNGGGFEAEQNLDDKEQQTAVASEAPAETKVTEKAKDEKQFPDSPDVTVGDEQMVQEAEEEVETEGETAVIESQTEEEKPAIENLLLDDDGLQTESLALFQTDSEAQHDSVPVAEQDEAKAAQELQKVWKTAEETVEQLELQKVWKTAVEELAAQSIVTEEQPASMDEPKQTLLVELPWARTTSQVGTPLHEHSEPKGAEWMIRAGALALGNLVFLLGILRSVIKSMGGKETKCADVVKKTSSSRRWPMRAGEFAELDVWQADEHDDSDSEVDDVYDKKPAGDANMFATPVSDPFGLTVKEEIEMSKDVPPAFMP